MTSVAISQSNYLPWRGYFSLIDSSTDFVFLDDVQFTRRDWRTRNRIKTPQGLIWFSIPVKRQIRSGAKIEEIQIQDKEFVFRHLELIRRNYSRSQFFAANWPWFLNLLDDSYSENLSEFNKSLITAISQKFQISTRFHESTYFRHFNNPNQRLIHICKELSADVYFSGPKARNYLNEQLFRDSGIDVKWADYNFEEYPQLWGGKFEPHVSVIDLIFNTGFDIRKLKPQQNTIV